MWPVGPPTTIEEGLATLAALAAVGIEPGDQAASASAPSSAAPVLAGEPAEHSRRRVAEARYRTLIEQTPAVTFLASLSGGQNESYVSPQTNSLLGFTSQECVSTPPLRYPQ